MGAALVAAFAFVVLATTCRAAPVRVEFRFQHETASIANLAGSFNGWCDAFNGQINTSIDPMDGPDAEGWWTLEKLLEPGYYQYKFVADGNQWFTDPLNPRIDYDNNWNSILDVYDPLVYYVLPKDGTLTGAPRPEITANLAKSDGATFDLAELRIFVDEVLEASGPSYYDGATGRVSYTPDHDLANGTHKAKIRIELTTGASHADSTSFDVFADTVPPVIEHTPPPGASANAELHIQCTIIEDVGIEAAALLFRNEGDTGFSEVPMYGGLDDEWAATVPAGFTVAGLDLEYYIEASDLTTTSRSPETGVHAVPVIADDTSPVIYQAFCSPSTFDPSGVDDESRLSFRLSEPAFMTVEVRSAGGTHVRTLLDGEARGAGYSQVVWDGGVDVGGQVVDGDFRFHVNAVDGASLPADEVTVDVTADSNSAPGPINVVLLFHANQNLNYQGDTANDVCFNGLLKVLRRHPDSKFMLHFSGTLLHDLGWFNYRNSPSTIDILRAGAADGQFEIVGSTYAQNIPYSTHMWDNNHQVEIQREVIETMVGASPVSFWNAERCWTQPLVPLLADNGYTSTWVEQQILYDSGTTAPEMAVRTTRLGGDEVIVFNDDWEMHDLNWAIDSGNSGGIIDYLYWLRSQDTYRDWVVCYCEDAEATGLWDYEGGGDPQDDWDNLDQVLTDMEATGWIRLTTMSEYLETHYPTEDLTPIVDGQGNWMVGPSQAAGYADWFDFNENAPYLNKYRSFFDTLRTRIQEVEARTTPGTPAADLVKHAIWNLVAHQFEFGCIGCGWWGNQDWHKAETLEGALLAAEAALAQRADTEIVNQDTNSDGVLDWTMATPSDFYIVSETGGRLLRWFSLFEGEEMLGNEIFMWNYYYEGWDAWYGGSGHNDDEHYTHDFVWNAWNYAPSAAPFTRSYAIRKHALNDFLSIDGGNDEVILDADYAAEVRSDTLRLTHSLPGLDVTKNYIARDAVLSVVYEFTKTGGGTDSYELTLENELSPSLLEVMNGGRGTLVYWDGAGTSSVVTPTTVGVMNLATERQVVFGFSETPSALSGRETVHGLTFDPAFEFTLSSGQTKTIEVTLGATATSVEPGDEETYGLRLRQNRPNPFNPLTTIEFETPSDGPVLLSVHNAAGKRVATIVDRDMDAGDHTETWHGVSDGGEPVASGVYFFRLAHGGVSTTTKGVLLR